jgi:hypothetical protein
LISQKEEMRTVAESSGVVLHDMMEQIYFYFIIFSQKRNGKRETHGRCGSSWYHLGAEGPSQIKGVDMYHLRTTGGEL